VDTLTHALSGALLARATAPRDAPPRSLPLRRLPRIAGRPMGRVRADGHGRCAARAQSRL